MYLWADRSQKLSPSEKEYLFKQSQPVSSIDEFWSHSWHGRQRWKVWSLLFLVHLVHPSILDDDFLLRGVVIYESTGAGCVLKTTGLLPPCRLRFVKNAWPALFISTLAAGVMSSLFALELLPGWMKSSNYAPPEPHVP